VKSIASAFTGSNQPGWLGGLKKTVSGPACHLVPIDFRTVRMGKGQQKKMANVAKDGAVYDDDRFVRCQQCGNWINARSPSSLFEHRGPLPHPRAEAWIDDDD
jgi:hypothetical protein